MNAAHLSVGQVIKAAMLASKDLKKTERDTLIAIMAHANGKGIAEPSVPGIAEYVGKSADTISRIIAKLVDLGRLIVQRRRGARSIYRLPAEAIARVVRAADPRQNRTGPPAEHTTSTGNSSGVLRDEVGYEASEEARGGRAPRWQCRGAALPVSPHGRERCPRHFGNYVGACSPCASELLAGAP
ncbi:helix-turn-helix domain-containing protein [Actinoplanes sp. HUAS TT8]|uniref:helix-turn-helix domain-containing protein n=1 Tax=Actinoplanes sp. HUAS TT8 TaxID=3447453 RepID=UPI003F51F859